MRIGCLHTAAGNIAVLERAAEGLAQDGLDLRHVVRADLLQAVGQSGGLTPPIAEATRVALDELSRDCDAVLLTCSSLGRVIDHLGDTSMPMLRVDRALAERAVVGGGSVIVFCAAPSSLEPTGSLFRSVGQATRAHIDLRLVPDAWDRFLAGDIAGYHERIADAVAAALAESVANPVALAQVSMADAVEPSSRVLTSPAIGLAAAVARCR